MKYKVGIVGAPGSGKSTLAAGLLYTLKTEGAEVEVVPELVKYKVLKGEDNSQIGFDIQNTLEQLQMEQLFMSQENLEWVICENPLINGYIYSKFYEKVLETQFLKNIAENCQYSVLIYLQIPKVASKDFQYHSFGRRESFEEAIKLDSLIQEYLLEREEPVIAIDRTKDITTIIKKIQKECSLKMYSF